MGIGAFVGTTFSTLLSAWIMVSVESAIRVCTSTLAKRSDLRGPLTPLLSLPLGDS